MTGLDTAELIISSTTDKEADEVCSNPQAFIRAYELGMARVTCSPTPKQQDHDQTLRRSPQYYNRGLSLG